MVKEDLLYHKEHEWVRVEGARATVGISDFAQEALGDIVFLEIPKVGTVIAQGKEITEIESTKTTSMLYAPVGGKIVAVNNVLEERPELINDDAYGEGWIAVIEMDEPKTLDQLMTASEYEAFLKNEKPE